MSYEILIPDQVNQSRLVMVSITLALIGSLLWIAFNSSIQGLYLIIGLVIMSGIFSVFKFQIQPKFINIIIVGLLSIGIAVLYSCLAFQSVRVWEIASIIIFYSSSVYLSKAFTILQSMRKIKKEA